MIIFPSLGMILLWHTQFSQSALKLIVIDKSIMGLFHSEVDASTETNASIIIENCVA